MSEFDRAQGYFGKGRGIEWVLDELDKRNGPVAETFSPQYSPAEALYDRIITALGEGVGYFRDDEQYEDFSTISWAFPIIAIHYFSRTQQSAVRSMYREDKDIYFSPGAAYMELTPRQSGILSRIAAKAGVEHDPEQTRIGFGVLDNVVTEHDIRHSPDFLDPQVETILQDARQSGDVIGYLQSNIEDLNLRQQVLLLLKLSNDEYEEFIIGLEIEDDAFIRTLLQVPGLAEEVTLDEMFPDPSRHIYVLEAELRRQHLREFGEYLALWDEYLDKE